MFGLHQGFGQLDAGFDWLSPSGGGIRGNQLLAQHSNITIGGFVNINMRPVRRARTARRSGRFELSARRW